jgi:hypothetical protein
MENNQAKGQTDKNDQGKGEQVLPVHNPLQPDDSKQITQEDIDNEQKYKEALTERD